jgi:predicted porin
MKKSLVALAAMAVAGIASAQSSVTLFGVVDAAISGYSNKSEDRKGPTLQDPTYVNRGSATTSQSALSSSGYNASRIGFRGTEDLGGGLAASFWLEAGIDVGEGTGASSGGGLQFNRRSTVSLSGAFGEVRLGRDYTPTYWNDTVFDPFGTNGVGTSLIYTANNQGSPDGYFNSYSRNSNYARASNSVGYFLPANSYGVYGQLMYAFNESPSVTPGELTGAKGTDTNAIDSRAGRYIGGRLGYANGPVDVALSYGSSTTASDYFAGTTTNLDTWNLGASYDFGMVKLFGEYSSNKSKTDRSNPNLAATFGFTDPGAKGWLVGASMPVGAGLIRASYSGVKYDNLSFQDQAFNVEQPKADKFAIGYVYNLSKRTALYTTVAYVNNKNGAALTVGGPGYAKSLYGSELTPKNSTGYDLGIRHSF